MCKITVAQKNLLLQFVAKRFSMPTFLLFLDLGKIVLIHIFVIVNPTVHFCGRQSHVNLFLALVLRRSRQLLERLSKALFVFFRGCPRGIPSRGIPGNFNFWPPRSPGKIIAIPRGKTGKISRKNLNF